MTLEIRPPGDLEPSSGPPSEPWRDRARQHLVATRVAAVAVVRARGWSAWRVARQLPGAGWRLLVWSPRGVWRLARALAAYVRDEASAELVAHHAREHQAGEHERASRTRSTHLRARGRGVGAVVALALALALAWWAPDVLAVLVGVAVLGVVVRLLPWQRWEEIPVALTLAGVAWWGTPLLAALVPRPPWWVWWIVAPVVVLGCGWTGRPRERAPLVERSRAASTVPQLTAPVALAALVALGNSKMKDPDQIGLLGDPHRHGKGTQIEFELPGSVTADWVIEQRAPLAAALRRELGCVWPSVGPRHPGHLVLFASDVAMSKARQDPWPLLRGRPVNVFEPIPLFTDQRGEWVKQTLAYTAWVIGAVPRMGKTIALRNIALAAALDPRTKLYVFDLKGTGDLSALARVAAGYGIGDEPEEIEEQLAHMRAVHAEMRRRTRLIRAMPLTENPEKGKVTDALATRSPQDFGPIFLVVDECQIWFEEYDDKDVRMEFIKIARDLVKRGPALGIIPLYATQKPDAKSIPSGISANASARLCLKVNGQVSNDQILGTSMYQAGIRATQFAFSEKGVAYFIGDGADPLIVRTVFGVDAARAEEIVDRAIELRTAAGLLADPDVVDAEIVLDIVADVHEAMVRRGRETAHLRDVAEWLRETRPDYATLDAAELGKRLRNEGVRVSPDIRIGGRTTSGVRVSDLRKHIFGDDDETVGEDD